MHLIRNGYLLYGAVVVPVGVCTSASRKEKTFKTLHKECGQPISQVKQCVTCQADNLSPDELVKGYEFTKKNYVEIDNDVLANIVPRRSEVIQVHKCVSWEDLDETYRDSSYYLSPSTVSPLLTRPYQLLANALGGKEAIAMGTASLWGKEYPIAVYARESGVLMLSTLYCHEDVTPDLEIVEQFGLVPDDEQEFANMWVAASMRDLNPQEDLVTAQRVLTDQYIASLIQGEEFKIADAGPEPTPTVDVMAALRKSVELARTAT